MDKHQPIGVIDSGVGGLTVLKRLQILSIGSTSSMDIGRRCGEKESKLRRFWLSCSLPLNSAENFLKSS